MEFIADLHIHSYLSRATAKNLNLEHLNLWAQLKGITVVATGDFTHPQWFSELSEKLEPAEEGLFKLKSAFGAETAPMVPASCEAPVRFILSVEISNIYKKAEKTRKVHNVILAPSLEVAKRIKERLARIGNVASDGRPILGLDSKRLLEMVLEVSPDVVFIPAHIWTPWFSILGSKSGFDSIEECFDDLTPEVFALETGLSADPAMIWRLSSLDHFTLVSNSDAHSPSNLGREANLFDTDLSYPAIRDALRTGDLNSFLGTLEYFPEEGKYHFDGHRKCGVRLSPVETLKNKKLCPVCGKPVTIGVMHRVEELADREVGEKPTGVHSYTSVLPLTDVLSEVLQVGPKSKKVTSVCRTLFEKCGSEFEILRKAPLDALDRHGPPLLGEAIQRMRHGQVQIAPGYDGEFGTISLFTKEERQQLLRQERLFAMPSKAKPTVQPQALQPSMFETGQTFGSRGAPTHSGRHEADPGTNRKSALSTPSAICTKKADQAATRQGFFLQRKDGPSQHYLPTFQCLLGNVNKAQQEAVQHIGGPLLIVAGPGTGKTRTLTHRIGYLIAKGIACPEQVLALTFTNKAAQEMTKRLRLIADEEGVLGKITIKTFHALCLDIISCEAEAIGINTPVCILNEADRKDVLRIAMQQEENDVSPGKADLDNMLHLISLAKQQMLSPEDDLGEAAPGFIPSGFKGAYGSYQELLLNNHLVDFDDLVFKTVKLFENHEALQREYQRRFAYISVDEYQDINYAQYRLIRLLTTPFHDICVIGDPDQAIYGFRGADVRYFQRFCQDYPAAKTISLTQNYRSTETILRASGQVMGAGTSDGERRGIWSGIHGSKAVTIVELPTERAEAEYVVKTIEQEVGGISHFSVDSGRIDTAQEKKEHTFSDFVVLYRVKEQAKAVKEAFERSGIPFQAVGDQKLATRRGIRELISYLKVGLSLESDLDVGRILNFPQRGISQTSVDAYKRWSATMGVPLLTVLNRAREAPRLLPKAQAGLIAFLENVKGLRDKIRGRDVYEQLQVILGQFSIADEMSNERTFEEHVATLLALSKSFAEDSNQFLAHLALQGEQDLFDPEAESVALMTMHAAKGLEFPVVFVIGCEDGLIPYRRKEQDHDDLTEERRLFYVAMTRAQDKIFLTHAAKRRWFGKRTVQCVSPFLQAIEEGLKQYKRPFSGKPIRKKNIAQLSLFHS